jgi:pyruvate kinase
VPEGAVLSVPEGFEGEFSGDAAKLAGIVDAHRGTTGYAAMVARELSLPMIADARLPEAVADGKEVTLDAERGIVYDDAVREHELERH